MTNAQIIATLSAKIIAIINHRMNDIGDTLEAAQEHARKASCAGPAVWEVVDEHFA